jgi:hypothetical protein
MSMASVKVSNYSLTSLDRTVAFSTGNEKVYYRSSTRFGPNVYKNNQSKEGRHYTQDQGNQHNDTQ